MTSIRLIVGLGNPGPQYLDTRHNVGFWFADFLSEQYQFEFEPKTKFHGAIAKFSHDGHDCWVLKPSTFMNRSGMAVQAIAKYYDIIPEEILVVHDELDFPVGNIKLKTGGGHGGHNGLRDIIKALDSNNFHRLRIGIDHPGDKNIVADYVLHKPSKSDEQKITDAIDLGICIVPELLQGDLEKAKRILANQNRE